MVDIEILRELRSMNNTLLLISKNVGGIVATEKEVLDFITTLRGSNAANLAAIGGVKSSVDIIQGKINGLLDTIRNGGSAASMDNVLKALQGIAADNSDLAKTIGVVQKDMTQTNFDPTLPNTDPAGI